MLKSIPVPRAVGYYESRVCFLSILGSLGSTGELPRARSPRSTGQRRNVMAAMAVSGSSGFSSGVVKVLVSFYRSGENSAFESHRSRVTFDLSKQASVAAFKKHLREFHGLNHRQPKFASLESV